EKNKTKKQQLLTLLTLVLSILFRFLLLVFFVKKKEPLTLVFLFYFYSIFFSIFSVLQLSKQYGSVFTVHFGPKKVVILSGYKAVKQALVNLSEEFGERDITPIFHDFNQGYGILFSNGENWREMRRFALSNLRDFGMGKKRSEQIITEETQYLKEEFEKFEGKPFETTLLTAMAVSNVISAIIYSTRFEYSNTKLHHMVKRAYENMRMTGSTSVQLYNMFPWIRPFVANQKRIVNNVKETVRQSEEIINGLKKTLNPLDPRGIADCFLIQQQKDEESGKTDSLYNSMNLYCTINNLFGAGTDTTATTLRWGLLLMAKYPEIQARVQDEIDRVIGGRQPVAEDRKNLSYTDAVIHETQRFANIVCVVLWMKMSGKLLTVQWTSNSLLIMCHRKCFLLILCLLLFSGRRVCPGEGLARMELFLFFTSLLQHFRFTPPPGVSEDELDLSPVVGFTLNPALHKLCAVKRS
uniref:Cytochrome P450, family 2, subfamily K, polypeptide 22 n=1 Tax=Sinocyclocheilus rhinocerous TaxID=307959 RepID=A0A673J4U8_9TELE